MKIDSAALNEVRRLSGIKTEDLVALLSSINANPVTFFDEGRWVNLDFSQYDMRLVQFKGATVVRCRFAHGYVSEEIGASSKVFHENRFLLKPEVALKILPGQSLDDSIIKHYSGPFTMFVNEKSGETYRAIGPIGTYSTETGEMADSSWSNEDLTPADSGSWISQINFNAWIQSLRSRQTGKSDFQSAVALIGYMRKGGQEVSLAAVLAVLDQCQTWAQFRYGLRLAAEVGGNPAKVRRAALEQLRKLGALHNRDLLLGLIEECARSAAR